MNKHVSLLSLKKLNCMRVFFSFDSAYIFSLETRSWVIFVIDLPANKCMNICFV